MKLKKVEIKGFKSFALKTEIQIKEGITAIVGPNGSGKSNISDAIRWVLGEQSVKNLRGHKMEDVIFAGTSTRKPLGYCEVTIVFDNKDGKIPLEYNEVEVTRRMFRSGESQYYLNKSSCRLKDIKEIFMDTGVGKDGYSIIGQGRIEEILSNKPEDRRSIFEEAAGIVKYKSKKTEAEKKLEKTQTNIIRIKDLVHELSKQKDTLEVQASKAKEFNELYGELKDLEVNMLVADIKKNKAQMDEIDKKKVVFEDQLHELVSMEKKIEEKFQRYKEDIKENEARIEQARDYKLRLNNKCDENKNKLAILDEKENFHNKDLKRIKEEIENTNIKINEIDTLKDEFLRAIKGLEEKHKNILGNYKKDKLELEDKLNRLKEKEDQIENRKNDIIDIYNKASDIKSRLNSIVSFNESITKRIESLSKDIETYIKQKDDNERLLKEETEKKEEELRKSQILKDKLEDIQNKLNISKEKSNNTNSRINSINLERQSRTSSLRLLKSMEEDYEGYYKGVKSILIESKKNQDIGNGLVGVVAEMIKVDKRYEKAIEISLGSNGQNIVTENEYFAKNIIQYLKKNKLGRVTCLPLNIIKGRDIKLSEKDKEQFNIIGLGYEVIEYEKKYENIFKYLLGRTIIIENVDRAIEFAKKSKHIYRIVTLAGEVLNPGGSMTGGSHRGGGVNIINRKNRIEKLKEEVKQIEIDLETAKKEQMRFISDNKSLENEFADLQNQIKENEFIIYNIGNNILNYQNEQKRMEEIIEKSNQEILELQNEERERNIQYDNLNIELSNIEKDSVLEKDNTKKMISNFNKEKQENEIESKRLTEIKVDINQIKNNIDNLQEKKDNAEKTKKELLVDLENKEDLVKNNEKQIEEIEDSRDQLISLIEKINIEEEEISSKLSKLMEVKNKTSDKFYIEQENLTNTNKSIGLKEKEINSLDIKLAKISTELKNYEDRLLEEYELRFEEVADNSKEIIDMKKSIVRIRRLRVSIKELGNVNLSSIEEYKSLNNRLEFILKQQDDLMESKDNLNNIICDMEEKMKEQFLLNFKKINDNFIQVFKVLFNGGKAELVLEDENDILNSGIQINAQPPGKKLQSLTLLSGGEKSLTAVALLFSILTLRPAPFCILDEIDASLDEANISKYTSYLNNFSYDTQFVLITHRKTTMEIADNLYGVTMEENGISKLISVKLKDYVDEIAS